MTIDELANKLMDKSSEVYEEHCGVEVRNKDLWLAVKYWEGWSEEQKEEWRREHNG